MTREAFVFTALLLTAGMAAAWQPPGSVPAPKPWNVQFEALRLGRGVATGLYMQVDHTGIWYDSRFVSLAASYRRFRLGVSLLSFPPMGNSILPVEAGYTIYQRPVRYGWFQGMVPDVFAEAGLYWANGLIDDNPFDPTWKAGVRAELDYYGLGAGAEAALFYSRYSSAVPLEQFGPSVSLYLRLVTNLGF